MILLLVFLCSLCYLIIKRPKRIACQYNLAVIKKNASDIILGDFLTFLCFADGYAKSTVVVVLLPTPDFANSV